MWYYLVATIHTIHHYLHMQHIAKRVTRNSLECGTIYATIHTIHHYLHMQHIAKGVTRSSLELTLFGCYYSPLFQGTM
jgi:hypothetical protein